jgi:hypothetical protein
MAGEIVYQLKFEASLHLLLMRVGPHPHALYALRATAFGLAAAQTAAVF